MKKDDSAEAIGAVDALLASIGLEHGRRSTRGASWRGGERVGQGSGALRKAAKKPVRRRAKAGGGVPVVRANWPVEADWLRHGFSTRAGGASTVYGGRTLNLGWTKEDDAADVAQNRRALVDAVAGDGARLVTVRQIHSPMIRVVGAGDGPLTTDDGRAVLR